MKGRARDDSLARVVRTKDGFSLLLQEQRVDITARELCQVLCGKDLCKDGIHLHGETRAVEAIDAAGRNLLAVVPVTAFDDATSHEATLNAFH